MNLIKRPPAPDASPPLAITGDYAMLEVGGAQDNDLAFWARKLLLHPSVPHGIDEWHVVARILGWDDQLIAKRDGV